MKTYFVRKETDHEVVGLFTAPSATILAALVDEYCDPGICQYAEPGAGGLAVPGTTRARWPLAPGQSSISTGIEGAVLSQQWEDDLDSHTSPLEWKSLKPAALRMLRSLASADTGADSDEASAGDVQSASNAKA